MGEEERASGQEEVFQTKRNIVEWKGEFLYHHYKKGIFLNILFWILAILFIPIVLFGIYIIYKILDYIILRVRYWIKLRYSDNDDNDIA